MSDEMKEANQDWRLANLPESVRRAMAEGLTAEQRDIRMPHHSYKCPHCGAMHVDASRVPACLADPVGAYQAKAAEEWAREKGPNFDPYAIPPDTQRIRDLEREVATWTKRAIEERIRAESVEREVERLAWELSDARDECHDRWTPTEVAAEVAQYKAEVERVTRMAAADLLTRLDVERMAEAYRVDAMRFRWWMRNRWTWGASNFPDAEIIAKIDADRAKVGGA